MIRKADFLGLFTLNLTSEQSAWQALHPEQSPATAATTRMGYHFLLIPSKNHIIFTNFRSIIKPRIGGYGLSRVPGYIYSIGDSDHEN